MLRITASGSILYKRNTCSTINKGDVMNKKNGFTLVELMVVIVIIGVLAAVAIPKMMAATNKAKAGEGPQILRAIASMEAAYKAENDTTIAGSATGTVSGVAATIGDGWYELGFDPQPFSRYFMFDVVPVARTDFLATAELAVGLGSATPGDKLTVDIFDKREVDPVGGPLSKLVPNWK
jgi:prepilin-type N-terminal cleavage/methylation domain-containing protein